MSVMSVRTGRPASAAVRRMLAASSRAESSVGMNAPLPDFTSMTSASRPAAIFFDRIDAVMSGTDSTVPVTSRIA